MSVCTVCVYGRECVHMCVSVPMCMSVYVQRKMCVHSLFAVVYVCLCMISAYL